MLKRMAKDRAMFDIQLKHYTVLSDSKGYSRDKHKKYSDMVRRIQQAIVILEKEQKNLPGSNNVIVKIINTTKLFLTDIWGFLGEVSAHVKRLNMSDISMLVVMHKKISQAIYTFQSSVDAEWNIVNESMQFLIGGTTPPDMEKAIDMLFLPETMFLEVMNCMRHQMSLLSQFAYTCLPETSISGDKNFQDVLSYIIPEADYTSKYMFSVFIMGLYSYQTVQLIVPPVYAFYDAFASRNSFVVRIVNGICKLKTRYGTTNPSDNDENAVIKLPEKLQFRKDLQYWEQHRDQNPLQKYQTQPRRVIRGFAPQASRQDPQTRYQDTELLPVPQGEPRKVIRGFLPQAPRQRPV